MSDRTEGVAGRVAQFYAATRTAHVAVLWDLENLQATAFDVVRGRKGAYGESIRERGQAHRAQLLRLGAVSDKLRSVVGPLAVNRAYADWGLFKAYNKEVIAHAILPCHVPQLSGMKNAADIRLAVDAVDLLSTHPHVTHFVIASNDSDFCAVAQHLRMAGKTVIGLAVEGAPINQLWRMSCDQFLTIPGAAFGHNPKAVKPKPAPAPHHPQPLPAVPKPAAEPPTPPVPLTQPELYLKELAERYHVVVPPAVVRMGLFALVVRGFADGDHPEGKSAPALDEYLHKLFTKHGRPIEPRQARALRQLLSIPRLLSRNETRWDLAPEIDAPQMERAFREWARGRVATACGTVDEVAFEAALGTAPPEQPAAA